MHGSMAQQFQATIYKLRVTLDQQLGISSESLRWVLPQFKNLWELCSEETFSKVKYSSLRHIYIVEALATVAFVFTLQNKGPILIHLINEAMVFNLSPSEFS